MNSRSRLIAGGIRARLRDRALLVATMSTLPKLERYESRYTTNLPTGYERIHLYHVRKTGGTSLYNTIMSLGGEDPRAVLRRITKSFRDIAYSGNYTFSHDENRYLRLAPCFFTFSHVPAWQRRPPSGTYTVAILRDPLARLLSLYHYLADPRADYAEVVRAPVEERGWAKSGFSEFVQEIPASVLLAQLYMFSKDFSPAAAAQEIRRCSCWFFTESYDSGLAALSRSFNVHLPIRHDRTSNARGSLDREALKDARDQLWAEYEMLHILRLDPGPGFVGTFPSRSG